MTGHYIDFTHKGAIAALWKLKMDTADIAKKLNLPEWQVAKVLAAWRDSMHEVKK